jgi:hypothetical protein
LGGAIVAVVIAASERATHLLNGKLDALQECAGQVRQAVR